MKKSSLILGCICLAGTLYHASFLHLNEVMKIADSFAYLQMSYFLGQLSQEGLGNGWFGFVYSLPIALVNSIIGNDFFAAKIVNLFLFNISAILLWKISKKVFHSPSQNIYAYLIVILFFLSPTLLHFNIHILSENIYIPLFLGLFLVIWDFIEASCHVSSPSLLLRQQKKQAFLISLILGLMYLTRAEAFIYIGSIGIIPLYLLYKKYISLKNFFWLGSLFFIVFFLFISPYLFHLHSLTGEWGLTNKGASNLRQAELRGQEKMDDAGFERAVAELTPDKHHLIAGFAGGMPYDTPQIEGSLKSLIVKNPSAFGKRILKNQGKLFSRNLPEIFLGKSPKLYWSEDLRFSHKLFLLWILIPLGVLIFGIYSLAQKQKVFFGISLAFFLPACLFFTLFFTLNRYFLIFLPLFLVAFIYGVSQIKYRFIQIFLLGNFISILLLSTLVYYNTESPKDEYYRLKQTAGKWLAENTLAGEKTKIMERFPIVTYYAGSKTRYITPYTTSTMDVWEYGNYHNIDILVVDTIDFLSYRPALETFLEKTPKNFIKLKEFSNTKKQKVILYELKK